jgi:hypothetical protein
MDHKYQVRKFRDSDESAYSAFVDKSETSLLFQSLPYFKLIQELTSSEQETLLAIDEEGSIVGVLPLLAMSGGYGMVLNSLPYYGSNGGIISKDEDAAKLLLESYNDIVGNAQIAASTLVENPLDEPMLVDLVKHSVIDSRIGQFTSIDYTSEIEAQLMESFHCKTRNMVRKAQKSGFSFDVENDSLEFVAEIHKANIQAIGGRAKKDTFFSSVPKYFAKGKDYKIWVAHFENQPVSALLVFYYRETVEYYLPVTIEQFRDKQPLSLLIFEAMKDASRRGYKLWNWGGTWASQIGVHRFKKRWGTKDRIYNYYTQINNKEIYKASSVELLEQYGDFFVLPFQFLTENPG